MVGEEIPFTHTPVSFNDFGDKIRGVVSSNRR
jgi:hypothetical protein